MVVYYLTHGLPYTAVSWVADMPKTIMFVIEHQKCDTILLTKPEPNPLQRAAFGNNEGTVVYTVCAVAVSFSKSTTQSDFRS